MFPFLKDLASKYPVPKKDLAGGINISATDGETFVPQEMVDDVGLGNLEFFNNKPKEGGHQSIDSIIAFETLQNIKPVSNGGEIQLDNFMGGGPLMNYENGGQTPEMDIRRNTANLGPSPYMRYERSGGVPVQGDPLYDERRGYIDDFIKHTEQRADFMPFETREGFQKFVESGEGNMRDEMLLKRLLSSLHETGIHYDKGKADIDNLNFLAKQGYQLGADEISSPSRRLLDSYAKEMDILDNIKRTSSFFNKQNGGLTGMEHGGPLPKGSTAEKTPNPFVPFDQRPNQDTASGRWGEPGAYMRSLAGAMDSLNMEDSIMTHKKGQNFLNKLRIKSMLNGEGTAIENPRPKYLYDGLNMRDTIQQGPTMRDLNEYFNSQLMQGRDSAAIEQGRQYRRPFPGY